MLSHFLITSHNAKLVYTLRFGNILPWRRHQETGMTLTDIQYSGTQITGYIEQCHIMGYRQFEPTYIGYWHLVRHVIYGKTGNLKRSIIWKMSGHGNSVCSVLVVHVKRYCATYTCETWATNATDLRGGLGHLRCGWWKSLFIPLAWTRTANLMYPYLKYNNME